MLENLLPKDYLPYLEYIPDVKLIINTVMPLAPLYTYGTTCWGIHKKKLSVGYSIDICATMLISSILRILYYFISPYELSLLRQSMVMIAIQCLLLKVSLAYRPLSYTPDNLGDPKTILDQLATLPPIALVPALETDTLWVHAANITSCYGERALQSLLVWAKYMLSLFDVHYRRPGYFWQWSHEVLYWRFLQAFTITFSIFTIVFHNSPTYGFLVGCLGLFTEALLPLPQIMMIHRLQSIENFKAILLVSWLAGDCLKLSYLFFGTDNVLALFFMAAFFQMGLDLIILGQYLHYSRTSTKERVLPMYDVGFVDNHFIPLPERPFSTMS